MESLGEFSDILFQLRSRSVETTHVQVRLLSVGEGIISSNWESYILFSLRNVILIDIFHVLKVPGWSGPLDFNILVES